MNRQPCHNCPWRRDAPREYWDPQHFADISVNSRDDGLHTMGCHKSTPENMVPCMGWVRVMGFDAIGVRLLASSGQIDPNDAGTGGDDLFDTFDEMLEANRIDAPPRNCVVPPCERHDPDRG